ILKLDVAAARRPPGAAAVCEGEPKNTISAPIASEPKSNATVLMAAVRTWVGNFPQQAMENSSQGKPQTRSKQEELGESEEPELRPAGQPCNVRNGSWPCENSALVQ